MYTENPQIRISLLNYSHSSSINLSFDVLYGLFRHCPLYQYVDCRILHHCVTSLEKNSFFEMLYFWWKSSNSCFQIVSALCGKVHGKTLCNIYCWSLAKFREKIGLLTVNSFPIQAFKFIHFVSSGTMLALLLLFSVLMGETADGQVFFWQKKIGFDFLLFNYMLLSEWFGVQTFKSLLLNWIGNSIL